MLQPLLPPPPFLHPAACRERGAGGDENARVRDHEKTNGRPHLASNHLTRGPELPTMPCGAWARHRRLRPAQAQPASPAARETREGPRSNGSRHLFRNPPTFFLKK